MFGMSDAQKIDWLDKLSGYLSQSSIVMDIIRELLWGLVKVLKFLVDACQTIYDEAFKLLSFSSFAGLDKFFNNTELKIVLGILVAIALITLGATLLVNHGEKKPRVFQTMLIFFIVMTILPTLMQTMNEFILNTKDFVNGNDIKMSNQVIATGITDLSYIADKTGIGGGNGFATTDENGMIVPEKEPTINNSIFKFENGLITGGERNNFFGTNLENVIRLNPTSRMLKGGIFGYKLDDDKDLEKIEQEKQFVIIDYTPKYYRYHIDFISVYISLVAVGLVFICTGFKIARIIWELAVHHLLAVLFSASDFTNGQKAKQVLKSIASSYIVIMLTCFLLKFFMLGQMFLSQTISNPIASCFFLVAFAVAVIDGPNIIQQILGIDAGISSGFKTFASIYMGGKAIGGIAKATGRTAKNMIGNAGVGIAGAVGSVAGGVEEAKKDKDNSKSNFNNNINSSQKSVSNNINSNDNKNNNVQQSDNKPVKNNDAGLNNSQSALNNNLSQLENSGVATALLEHEPQINEQEHNKLMNEQFNNATVSGAISENQSSLSSENKMSMSVSQGVNDILKQNGLNIPADYKGNINIDNSQTSVGGRKSYADRLSGAFNKGRKVGGTATKGYKNLNSKLFGKDK